MPDSEYFFFPCFPIKKHFLLKISKDTFLPLHHPLPVVGLRGIEPGAPASYFSLSSSLPFCLLHLFSQRSSVLHYMNLSDLSHFTTVNGRGGSIPSVMALGLDLVHPHTRARTTDPTIWSHFELD